MAAQTITFSRTPATGASKSTGIPATPGAADYSLTDLDLLESPEAAADTPDGIADAKSTAGAEPGKGSEGAGETAADGDPAADSAAKPALAEFERAFELPGVGAKLREICERETAYREVFPSVADPRAHAELLAGLQRIAPEAFRSLAITFGERLAALDPEAHQQVASAMAAQALAGQRWPEQVALLTRAVDQQDWPAVKFLAATLASQMNDWSRSLGPGPSARQHGIAEPRPAQSQPQPAPSDMVAAASQFLQAVNTDVEQAVQQSVAAKVD